MLVDQVNNALDTLLTRCLLICDRLRNMLVLTRLNIFILQDKKTEEVRTEIHTMYLLLHLIKDIVLNFDLAIILITFSRYVCLSHIFLSYIYDKFFTYNVVMEDSSTSITTYYILRYIIIYTIYLIIKQNNVMLLATLRFLKCIKFNINACTVTILIINYF